MPIHYHNTFNYHTMVLHHPARVALYIGSGSVCLYIIFTVAVVQMDSSTFVFRFLQMWNFSNFYVLLQTFLSKESDILEVIWNSVWVKKNPCPLTSSSPMETKVNMDEESWLFGKYLLLYNIAALKTHVNVNVVLLHYCPAGKKKGSEWCIQGQCVDNNED